MTPASAPGAARLILRKLREIMSVGDSAQARLDRLVTMIASTMVADVCSIYLKRGTIHELFATEGLKKEAVHRTKLKENEGLVGLVAETARPLNIADAPNHPRFAYRPETGEDPYNSFLGVPIVRSERVFGVLVVQNRAARNYADEEVEALQTVAMVLEEMVAAGNFGDLSGLQEVEIRPSRPERLVGRAFADGIAIGRAVLHEPHAPLGRMIADDPVKEELRLDAALKRVRATADELVERDPGRLSGQSREVLETLRLLAYDRGWEDRLKRGVRNGLSADAAVANARNEHRARMSSTRDPYLRERMHDLEDLDNRLLRALAAGDSPTAARLPDDAVLVARDIGAAELLEYGLDRLRGVALEEGGASSHAAIIARALGIPMVGRIAHLSSRLEAGDRIVLDGERGEARLRPEPEVVIAYEQRLELRSAQAQEFARHRDDPAVTQDGRAIALLLNAGLLLDVQHLADAGAEGIGLFRTEFQFMVAEQLPRVQAQVKLYADVLDAAGGKPVTFRTLDVGGDKVLPYVPHDREENPALGWRAVRIALDRDALMKTQVRALVEAAEGRSLRVMFPLVTVPAEFDQARTLVEKEVALARAKGRQGPLKLEVGAMIEAPALAFAIPFLKGRADFLSIGTNDLMQYFFAADRGNPRVSERYDILCAPALRFLDMIRAAAAAEGIPLSICGEAAGKPLEAMTLIALGYDRLSMPASGVGPVKRMLRSLDAEAAREAVLALLESPATSLRAELGQVAKGLGVIL
ncbi:MAG: phosphoenolpyruvate--protein phosphotransferase [Hyphomonadaceae bacterium]|nr:phosphoenolpyruvate--protein phosphotransferase [Hyphomonadaceae bacterium]